jgi:hypothetical protein
LISLIRMCGNKDQFARVSPFRARLPPIKTRIFCFLLLSNIAVQLRRCPLTRRRNPQSVSISTSRAATPPFTSRLHREEIRYSADECAFDSYLGVGNVSKSGVGQMCRPTRHKTRLAICEELETI